MRYSPKRTLSPFHPLTLSCMLSIASTCGSVNAEDSVDAERLFTLKVLPILKDKCYGCHGNDVEDIKGGFDVRSRETLLKGGESEEPAIVPGKPDESPLYLSVTWDGLEMPPKENDRLTEEQIADFFVVVCRDASDLSDFFTAICRS